MAASLTPSYCSIYQRVCVCLFVIVLINLLCDNRSPHTITPLSLLLLHTTPPVSLSGKLFINGVLLFPYLHPPSRSLPPLRFPLFVFSFSISFTLLSLCLSFPSTHLSVRYPTTLSYFVSLSSDLISGLLRHVCCHCGGNECACDLC